MPRTRLSRSLATHRVASLSLTTAAYVQLQLVSARSPVLGTGIWPLFVSSFTSYFVRTNVALSRDIWSGKKHHLGTLIDVLSQP